MNIFSDNDFEDKNYVYNVTTIYEFTSSDDDKILWGIVYDGSQIFFIFYNSLFESTLTIIQSFYTANTKSDCNLLNYYCDRRCGGYCPNTNTISYPDDSINVLNRNKSNYKYLIDLVKNKNISDGFPIVNPNKNTVQNVYYVSNDPTKIKCNYLIITFYGQVLSFNTGIVFDKFNLVIDNGILSRSVYTGIEQVDDLLYLVDFNNKQIHVYDKNYILVSKYGAFPFIDPNINTNTKTFAPYNIKCIDENFMFVTYTLYVNYSSTYYGNKICYQNNCGYINVFTKSGVYINTINLINFSSPWAIAKLPNCLYNKNKISSTPKITNSTLK